MKIYRLGLRTKRVTSSVLLAYLGLSGLTVTLSSSATGFSKSIVTGNEVRLPGRCSAIVHLNGAPPRLGNSI
jgi:hypothetical protein